MTRRARQASARSPCRDPWSTSSSATSPRTARRVPERTCSPVGGTPLERSNFRFRVWGPATRVVGLDDLRFKAGRAIRLASELRRLREARGLSQRELAEQVGTTQSAIARLEAGNNPPNLLLLDRIADALGAELIVSLTDLDQRTSAG